MLTAIETQYKGYRFRSRLEARWAVFFDELGLRWEYEKEGYDLGEAGYYLPDFWLPDYRKKKVGKSREKFIEVKPMPNVRPEMRKLYLAGKFTGGTGRGSEWDWRESLVSLKGNSFGEPEDLPVGKSGESSCGFSYVGPYPVDMTGGHGSGMGHFEAEVCYQGEDGKIYEAPTHPHVIDDQHVAVKNKCLANIAKCDVFFAWIDSPECYGTLAEIGFARGQGKAVYVGVTPEMQGGELWFAQSMADDCIVASSPEEAFFHLFPFSEEEKKAKALTCASNTDTFIVYGEPADCVFSAFNTSWYSKFADFTRGCNNLGYMLTGISDEAIIKAALKARSARFEHGESGARKAA